MESLIDAGRISLSKIGDKICACLVHVIVGFFFFMPSIHTEIISQDRSNEIYIPRVYCTRFLFETSVYNEWRGTFSFASSHFFFLLLCPCCWYSTSTWCYQVCNRWRPTRQQHVFVEKRIHKALIIVLVWFCRFTLHCFSTLTNLCAGFIFHLWMRP